MSTPQTDSFSPAEPADAQSNPAGAMDAPAKEGAAQETADRGPLKDAVGEEKSRSGLPIWLFVLLLVAGAVVVGWQFQVAGELEQKIAGLESELAATTSQLGAHRTRLGEIRSGVNDLSAQLEGLKALVDADPVGSGSRPQTSENAREKLSRASSADARREIPARLPR